MAEPYQKVLMVGWEYPPHNSGGLGVACQGMTQALSDLNTQIYFTLPYQHRQPLSHMQVLSCSDASWSDVAPDKPPFQAYSSTVDLIQTAKTKLSSHQLRALPQSDMEQKVEQYAQQVNEQTEGLDEFELVHAHDWMSFPAGVKLKHKTGKPFIAHVHSTEQDRTPNGYGSPYVEKTEKKAFDTADRVVTVSYYTKRLLTNYYQVDENKIDVVHNGITPLPYQPRPGRSYFARKRPVVAFMGRLTNQKGAHFFINVGKKVMERIPNVLFVLAGSGHLYHELLLHTAGQQLTAKVLFSGFVRGKQKRRLLERSDVFVMPSLSEPFGLVAMEAAQHHTPVIVSKNTGVAEVMPSALKIDFWDEDKMAQQIVTLLKDRGFSDEIAAGQLREIKQATWKNSADKLRQVYRKAFL